MRILHVIDDLSIGGAEKLVSELAPILNKKTNVTVEVLLLGNDTKLQDNLIKNNVKVHLLNCKNFYNPLNILKLRKFVKKNDFDVVHAHLFPVNYWVSLMSLTIFKNKPVFVTTEHSTYNKRRKYRFFKFIEKFIYSKYDCVISISQATQNSIINWVGKIKKTEFQVVLNGISLNEYYKEEKYPKSYFGNYSDEQVFINETDILLCMVGRLSEQKDQKTIIDSLVFLPNNVYLVLVGDGPQKNTLVNYAREQDLKKRVIFLGERTDIPKILKSIDIVIVSSKWEGFGLSAVEGMAANKPVIASKVSGLEDIVEGAGLLFEKSSPEDLFVKITDLLENKETYKDIQKRCLDRSEKFSIVKMCELYFCLYNKLIKRSI